MTGIVLCPVILCFKPYLASVTGAIDRVNRGLRTGRTHTRLSGNCVRPLTCRTINAMRIPITPVIEHLGLQYELGDEPKDGGASGITAKSFILNPPFFQVNSLHSLSNTDSNDFFVSLCVFVVHSPYRIAYFAHRLPN